MEPKIDGRIAKVDFTPGRRKKKDRVWSRKEKGSPEHDAIMMWLDQNIVRIVEEEEHRDWPPKTAEVWTRAGCRIGRPREREFDDGPEPEFDWETRTLNLEKARDRIPPFPGVKASKVWELSITNSKDRTIGFIDMAVYYDELTLRYKDKQFSIKDRRKVEYYEVKPEITSVGQLLRQLKKYDEFLDRYNQWPGLFTVVSPDTRYRKIIQEQGYAFLECPKPEIK